MQRNIWHVLLGIETNEGDNNGTIKHPTNHSTIGCKEASRRSNPPSGAHWTRRHPSQGADASQGDQDLGDQA